MKTLWLKEDPSDEVATIADGVKLNEKESELLFKLTGALSLNSLREKGFSDKEAEIIQNWSLAI